MLKDKLHTLPVHITDVILLSTVNFRRWLPGYSWSAIKQALQELNRDNPEFYYSDGGAFVEYSVSAPLL